MDSTTADRGCESVGGAGGRLAHLLPIGNTGVKYGLWSSCRWDLVDAGVDWCTVTTADLDVAQRLKLRAWSLSLELERAGDLRKSLRWEGYEGWKVGPLFYGERRDGVCCWGSGAAAGPLFDSVCDLDVRLSRLDLQATLRTDADLTGFARAMADAADVRRVDPSRDRGRPITVRLIESYGAGDTLYVGSPKSLLRGRSYDKHKESQGRYEPGSWRWELQTRGPQARAAFERLRHVSELPRAITGQTARWWSDHGVPLPLRGVELGDPLRSVKQITDLDRTLAWLRSTVRPSADRWSAAGFREQVLEALGVMGEGADAGY